MKTKSLIVLLLAVSLFAVVIILVLNSEGFSRDNNSKKTTGSSVYYDWQSKFSLGSKNPYDLYIFKELVLSHGKFQSFYSYTNYNLLDSIVKIPSSIIMFIGENFSLTNDETNKVLQSVADGNDLFLSVEEIPHYLFIRLFEGSYLQFIHSKNVSLTIGDETMQMLYCYENDTLTYLWNVFKDDLSSPFPVQKLSEINGNSGFISLDYGKGKIFLHLNPIIFSNYQLLRFEGKSYLKKVLDLQRKENIQWLTFAKYELTPYTPDYKSYPSSLLSELSKHAAFRWGFIFAVLGWLLYLIFRSKRRQPIVPELENLKNTGYSYVDTLSGIYFDKNQSDKILIIMKQNFYSAVARCFYIDLSKKTDNKTLEKLSKKSSVEIGAIQHLLNRLSNENKVNNKYLGETYKLIHSFYFKSGIWSDSERKKAAKSSIAVYRKKEIALLFLLIGILMIFSSFYLLSLAQGTGVVLILFGLPIFFTGVAMLHLPILLLEKDSIHFISLLNKKHIVPHKTIEDVYQQGKIINVKLKNGKQLKINLLIINSHFLEELKNLKKRIKND